MCGTHILTNVQRNERMQPVSGTNHILSKNLLCNVSVHVHKIRLSQHIKPYYGPYYGLLVNKCTQQLLHLITVPAAVASA